MWDPESQMGVKASRRPKGAHLRFARATGGGFPRLSDGVAHVSRCSTPSCHALLAENLGKPSLGVNIKDLWYNPRRVAL